MINLKRLQQSVLNLRQNLEQLNGHLIIGEVSALGTLPELVKAYGITDIYAEQEYAPYELDLGSLKCLITSSQSRSIPSGAGPSI